MQKFSTEHNAATIQTYLDQLLANPNFRASEGHRQFLRFVVEETLAGRENQIKQYTVAISVFGHQANFDPQTDPFVRIHAQRLRRALDNYYETYGTQDTMRIELPKGGYIPVFHTRDFPLENNRQDSHTDSPEKESRKHQNGKWWKPLTGRVRAAIVASVVFLVLVGFVTAVWLYSEYREKSAADLPGHPVIALFSFEDLDGDAKNALFTSGLTREMVTDLTQFSGIQVIGPLSREKLDIQHSGFEEIGREYGVQFILDGSVRRENHNIRIYIKLIDAKSGVNIWAKSYNRLLRTAAMIHIEDDISRHIAIAVGDIFGPLQRKLYREANPRSASRLTIHEAILLYYHYLSELTPEANTEAMKALEYSVELDPDYGMAWAALAGMHIDAYVHFLGDSSDHVSKAVEYIRKAVRLDPRNHHVQEVRALIAYYTGQIRNFYKAAEAVIHLNPNTTMLGEIGMLYMLVGDYDRGFSIFEKATKDNPYYPGYFHIGPYLFYLQQGKFEKALAEAEQIDMPGFFWDPICRAAVLGQVGRHKEAKAALNELLTLVPNFVTNGRELLSRALYSDEHVEMIMKGLEKARLVKSNLVINSELE